MSYKMRRCSIIKRKGTDIKMVTDQINEKETVSLHTLISDGPLASIESFVEISVSIIIKSAIGV
jgi:hypothetical protein